MIFFKKKQKTKFLSPSFQQLDSFKIRLYRPLEQGGGARDPRPRGPRASPRGLGLLQQRLLHPHDQPADLQRQRLEGVRHAAGVHGVHGERKRLPHAAGNAGRMEIILI